MVSVPILASIVIALANDLLANPKMIPVRLLEISASHNMICEVLIMVFSEGYGKVNM